MVCFRCIFVSTLYKGDNNSSSSNNNNNNNNMVESDRPHMTVLDSTCLLHVGHYGYRHTISIHNTYFFSTATMIMQTHLNVTVIHTLSSLESSQRVCNSTFVSAK